MRKRACESQEGTNENVETETKLGPIRGEKKAKKKESISIYEK